MAYIEKKKINGKVYYYLTETKRVNGKFKKKRKYLGTKIPKDIKKHLKKKKIKIKHYLTERQLKIVDKIQKEYSKKYKIDKTLWKTETQKLISFIHNTNAIEGNTLSLKDTEDVLKGKKIKGIEKKRKDVKETKNMKLCIDFLFEHEEDISIDFILKLHKIEMNEIMQDAGQFRMYNVRVGNYFCPKYQELPKLMFELIDWYNKNKNKLHKIELASLIHLKFVKIHPFGDGNGRIARLLMNFVMLKAKYPLINIFNDEKMYYYLVLQKYDTDKKEKDFVKYIYEVFGRQYKKYLK
ncbi:MAG: Fic family protein [Candidatus Micrarchaeia archaeon]|jgi:Fic family protein